MFIKKFEVGFAIVVVYVDNMNLIETPKKLSKIVKYLKNEFEIKYLNKTKLCLDLELEHKKMESLCINQLLLQKYLKHFNMDKSHLLSSI